MEQPLDLDALCTHNRATPPPQAGGGEQPETRSRDVCSKNNLSHSHSHSITEHALDVGPMDDELENGLALGPRIVIQRDFGCYYAILCCNYVRGMQERKQIKGDCFKLSRLCEGVSNPAFDSYRCVKQHQGEQR